VRRHRLIILFVLGVALLGGLLIHTNREDHGPYYKGKYSSDWLDLIAGSPGESAQAAQAFREMGSNAVPYLQYVLTNKPAWRDSYVQFKSKIPKPVLGLTPAVPGINWPRRTSAAIALGEIGPGAQAALSILIAALNGGEPAFIVGGPSGGDVSQQWSPPARIAAVEALWKIAPDSAEVVTATTDALQQKYFPDDRIAKTAADCLAELGPEFKDAIPAIVQNLRYCDTKQYRPLPPNIYPLGALAPGYAESVPKLMPVLKDPDPRAREAAAYDLGALRRKELPAARIAIPALLATQNDRNENVRITAMEAICKIDVTQCSATIPVLVELLHADDFRIRLRSVDLLRAMGPVAASALPAIMTVTEDPKPIVRIWAREAERIIRQPSPEGDSAK